MDLKLEVGTASETVTVESATSPLETVNTSISDVVSQQRVQDLPLVNRDVGALITLQPGVVGDNMNGVRSQSQNITLDGVNVQETRYNGGAATGSSFNANLTTVNSVDQVTEFRVSTGPSMGVAAAVQGRTIPPARTDRGERFRIEPVMALSAKSWFDNQLGETPRQPVAPRSF